MDDSDSKNEATVAAAVAGVRDRNPALGIDAMTGDGGLSVAQLALLTRIGSPLMVGSTTDPVANIKALYLLSMSAGEASIASRNADDLERRAMEWADGIDLEEYDRRLDAAMDSILKFWKLLPRPDGGGDDEKKKGFDTGTETSRNSSNGRAAPTGGHSPTRLGRFLRSIWPFSTGAGRRA